MLLLAQKDSPSMKYRGKTLKRFHCSSIHLGMDMRFNGKEQLEELQQCYLLFIFMIDPINFLMCFRWMRIYNQLDAYKVDEITIKKNTKKERK
uniref:Uncharacterized protein n=1 Tax=Salix viminalis TaxID=40686 RepID=A0A6N2K8S9_SALVM